jgi:hypothetical protein
MATLSVAFNFASNAGGFVATAGTNVTLAWSATGGNPTGCLQSSLSSKNNNSRASSWNLSTTWALLGVPAGSTITAVSACSLDSQNITRSSVATPTQSGPATLTDGATVITLSSTRTLTDTTLATTTGPGASGLALATSDTITITINNTLSTANVTGSNVLVQDNLNFIITYTPGPQTVTPAIFNDPETVYTPVTAAPPPVWPLPKVFYRTRDVLRIGVRRLYVPGSAPGSLPGDVRPPFLTDSEAIYVPALTGGTAQTYAVLSPQRPVRFLDKFVRVRRRLKTAETVPPPSSVPIFAGNPKRAPLFRDVLRVVRRKHVTQQPFGVITPGILTDLDTIYQGSAAGGRLYFSGQAAFGRAIYGRLRTNEAVTDQSVAPPLYTETDAPFTPVVLATYTVSPTLYSDPDAGFAPTTGFGLIPPLYSDVDAPYAPVASSAYTVVATFYSDPDTPFTPTTGFGVAPSLFSESDGVPTGTAVIAGYNISPLLFTESDAPFTPNVGVSLTPGLFTDPDTPFAPAVQPGAAIIAPPLATETDAAFVPSVQPGVAAITPALYTDSDTPFAPAVQPGTATITPSLGSETDTIYSPFVQILVTGIITQNEILADPDTLYTPAVQPGAVAIAPSLYTDNDNPFVGTVVSQYNIQPAIFNDGDTGYVPSVSALYTLGPALYADPESVFIPSVGGLIYLISPPTFFDGDSGYLPAILPGAVAIAPSIYPDVDTVYTAVEQSSGTVAPLLFNEGDAPFSPSLTPAYAVAAALFTESDTPYVPSVGAGLILQIAPPLYSDLDTLYLPVLSSSVGLLQGLTLVETDALFGATVGSIRAILPATFIDIDDPGPAIVAEFVITPSFYIDPDNLFGPTVTRGLFSGIFPNLYVENDFLYTALVGRGIATINPPFYAEIDQTFFEHNVIPPVAPRISSLHPRRLIASPGRRRLMRLAG